MRKLAKKEIKFVLVESGIYCALFLSYYYPEFDMTQKDLVYWLLFLPLVLIVQYLWRMFYALIKHGHNDSHSHA